MISSSLKSFTSCCTRLGRLWFVQLGFCLVLGAVLSLGQGQDANWDLRNYHLYTPLHFLRGHIDRDFFAAGLQTYFNPTLDLPYAWLSTGIMAHTPRLLAAFMGLFFGGLIFVTGHLAAILLRGLTGWGRVMGVGLGTLTALTGAATFPQLGTTTNEIQIALLVLAGFVIVLSSVRDSADQGNARAFLGAGLCFGVAAGLKLTACFYAPALCLALLFVFRFGVWVKNCAWFSIAWGVGFLPPFAWWGIILFKRFASPTFPLFNALFKSPLYPPTNFFDTRFFPTDLVHWLFYPFFWATRGRYGLVSELSFRDPRLALALLIAALFLGAAFVRKLRVKNGAALLDGPQKVAFVFFVLSYGLWLGTTSILRYAVGIEILGVLLSLALIVQAAKHGPWPRITAPALILIVCVTCLTTTRRMDWGHIPFGKTTYSVDMNWVEQDTLFVTITGPTAYLAAFVPEDKNPRFVGFSFTTLDAKDWPLAQKTRDIVDAHKGPIVVLIPHGMDDFTPHLPLIGLSVDLSACHTIASNLDSAYGEGIRACRCEKRAP